MGQGPKGNSANISIENKYTLRLKCNVALVHFMNWIKQCTHSTHAQIGAPCLVKPLVLMRHSAGWLGFTNPTSRRCQCVPPRYLKPALIFQFPSCLVEEILPQTHDKTAAWSRITSLRQSLYQRTIVFTVGIDRVSSHIHTHTHTHTTQEYWLPSLYFILRKNFRLTRFTQKEFVKWYTVCKRNVIKDKALGDGDRNPNHANACLLNHIRKRIIPYLKFRKHRECYSNCYSTLKNVFYRKCQTYKTVR